MCAGNPFLFVVFCVKIIHVKLFRGEMRLIIKGVKMSKKTNEKKKTEKIKQEDKREVMEES